MRTGKYLQSADGTFLLQHAQLSTCADANRTQMLCHRPCLAKRAQLRTERPRNEEMLYVSELS